MRKLLTIAMLAVSLVGHAAGQPASLKLVRTPHFQFAPGYAILSARLEPDARNRGYCIIYSGGAEGDQCRDLAGADAPPTQLELVLKDLPAGHYTGYVSLTRWENDKFVSLGSNVVEWDVLEPGAELP